MIALADKFAPAGHRFTPCQRYDSLLKNFPRVAWGAARGVSFDFHPSVQASNNFETVNFRVNSFAIGANQLVGVRRRITPT
jgi:hypothetical protein